MCTEEIKLKAIEKKIYFSPLIPFYSKKVELDMWSKSKLKSVKG